MAVLPTQNSRRGGAGIGLLVVLISVALIFVLAFGAFGGKSHTQAVLSAKKNMTQTVRDITTNQLTQCILMYRDSHNDTLPATMEELEADNSSISAAKYDPWRKPLTFTYKKSGEAGRPKVTVVWRSDGPDGLPNTADDVVKEDELAY